MELTIDFELRCTDCHKDLDGEIVIRHGAYIVDIEACSTCKTASYDEGFADGKVEAEKAGD